MIVRERSAEAADVSHGIYRSVIRVTFGGPSFRVIATIRPIRGWLVRVAAFVQTCLDLLRHLVRLVHHVIELGEYRCEFVVAEGHKPIVGAAV